MDKDQLSVFAKISGIGSASGLFLKEHLLYVIGDNSAYLYEYNVSNKSLKRIEILKGLVQLENIPKADKPDFEVICNDGDSLFIIGSGSTSNRNLMIEYQLKSKRNIQYNLSSLYAKIKKTCVIDNENLNIEGAIFTGEHWYLFNRGNGNAQKNGVIKIYGKDLTKADRIEFTSIVLLKTNQELVSFTDAILHDDQIYFIAAAENTQSTYHDGEILGSYFGSLNMHTLSLNFIKQISSTQKLEGITFFKQRDKQLEFLVCEDRDTDVLETVVYKLII